MSKINNESEKIALVTGGGSGVGEQTCLQLAARGVAVAVVDRNLGAAHAVAQRIIGQGGKALAIAADVTDPQAVEAAVAQTVGTLGGLHFAVNNAGVPSPYATTEETTLEDWSRVIGINLTGTFLCLRAELPAIRASGGGAIVNLASILGLNGMAGRGPYAAAKHGVVGLTKSVALEYAEQGIRVNAVAPGYVDTPLLQGRSDEEKQRLSAMHPMQRMAQAAEIAAVIVFLLSPEASFVTGQTYLADGGYSAR